MSSRIFLIDAHAICYRAFYAVRGLKDSKGRPTNAVFGFCNILRKLLADCQPTHIAVCFDVNKPTYRKEKYADYKIQRQAMPDDLVSQIKVIRELIKAFRIPLLELEGYEADDVMATLARKFAGQGRDVFIASDDKDMAQLISEHVKLYSPRLEKTLDAPQIKEKFGVEPGQITDYIALAGDSSDNIPGVKGIGEVSAGKLLERFHDLEGIYQHIEEVTPPKVREKLEVGKASAFLSKDLATLHEEMPLKVDLDELKHVDPDKEKLFALFNELEFRKLAAEYAPAGVCVPELPLEEDLKTWVETIENGKSIIVAYDIKSLRQQGKVSEVQLKSTVFDVFLADYLLSGGQGQYHLVSQRGTEQGLVELYHIQKRLLKEQDLEFLFDGVEKPLCGVLMEMENEGVRMDVSVLQGLSCECEAKMKELEGALFCMAGSEFNINSPKQLSEVLFERLKLPVIKKTKTGFSTDEEVLNKLAAKHELPALILEYRQMAKLKSTYIDTLPHLIDPKTGRIHTTYNQTGAETGRLSSNNPNLQNIPIRTEFGRRIRKAFVADSSKHVLLSTDYSQVELRILAHLSRDEALKKAFDSGDDIHRHTASLMFDVPESEVTEQMRYAAKRINFGIVYGMSAFGLSKDLKISPMQAQDFIDKYFLRYPRVKTFLDGEIQKARDCGYVRTMFNRRRYLPDISNRNIGLRQFAERQAINAPMQGTAADLIKIAMVNISQDIKKHKLASRMILTVHDELVFDVPKEELQEMTVLVRRGMESAVELSVPLAASLKAGPNWLEMERVDG